MLLCCGSSVFAAIISPDDNGAVSAAAYLARRDGWLSGVTVNGQPTTVVPSGLSSVTASGGKALITTPAKAMVAGKELSLLSKIKPAIGATGKLAIALAKVAGPVGVAVTAYDLFSAVKDFSVQYKSPGVLDITRDIRFEQCVSGCYEYTYDGSIWFDSVSQVCSVAVNETNRVGQSNGYTYTASVSGSACEFEQKDQGGAISTFIYTPSKRDMSPFEGVKVISSTEDDLIRAIESETGLPNGVVEDTIKAGIESGLPLEVDDTSKQVTGPSTTSSPTITTKTNPDGSTETVTTTNNLTYQGNNVTVTNSSVTSNYNPVTNTTTTTTQTTQNPNLPTEPENVVVTDSVFADIPDLYTPKYPDGLIGVWAAKKAELNNTSLSGLTAVLMPNMAESGGSCPSWMLPLDLASWSAYGSVDVSPPCWIWDAVKAFVIFGALLLARSLVFGG